jgi:hypothetical protein
MTVIGTATTSGRAAGKLTRDQAKVLAHYAAGEASKTICVNTGFDMAFVGRILDEHAGNDRARAQQLVLEYQEHAKAVAAAKGTSPAAAAALTRPAAPAKPAAAAKPAAPAEQADSDVPAVQDSVEPGTVEPDASAGDGIGRLLEQADATDDPRLQRTAAKVRELVDGLRTDLAEHLRETQLRAEQLHLQVRLAEIKNLLRPRRAQPVLPAAVTASNTVMAAPDARAVRAWATEQGVDCPARGRIPGAVLATYQHHHATATAPQVTAR